MARTIVSLWHGVYLLDGSRVVREVPTPTGAESLAERMRLRHEGATTPEEETLLAERGGERWRSRDRRLARAGVDYDPTAPGTVERPADLAAWRVAVLGEAERALVASWDPSVHVEEAVRALRDLDRATNLIAERVASWAARDAPELEGSEPDEAARALLAERAPGAFAPGDPAVAEARRRLAELLLSLRESREVISKALGAAVPERAPNLHRLLGADLAARLVAQAGGLDRLARLPASTVQVLGAERAFFEHLRGRAPPPRHGLLFLHPSIQGAPRADRGRLARALAAKVAIAARLDRAGSPLDPTLAEKFERRREEVQAARRAAATRPRRAARLRAPLHGAAEDR